MRAQFDKAEVLRQTFIRQPRLEDAPSLFFGLDLGNDPSVAIVNQQESHDAGVPGGRFP